MITHILEAYSLLEYVEGSSSCPSKFLDSEQGVTTAQIDPNYLQWIARDKALISLISATLSPSAHSLIIGQSSAHGMWSVLLKRIKEARDKLAAVGIIVDDEDLLHIVLKGLPSKYESFSSAMLTKSESVPFEELHVLMIIQEELLKSSQENSVMAMAANKGHTTIDCYNRMNYSYQGHHPPAKLAAMASATPSPSPNYWIFDTSATDHFTPDLANLPNSSIYNDPQLVSVGNGQQLPISHIAPSSSHLHPDSHLIPESTNIHPMTTRSKDGISKKKTFHIQNTKPKIDYLQTEPLNIKIASQICEWTEAMQSKFDALQRQSTWSLVPPPPGQNIIGCRWVYKLKCNSDGSISCYKAHLVAKGFHQQAGLDFDETFNPVEDVYMIQPHGFVDPTHPDHVCKLQKSLYGLKQAPRAWFERFTSHLLTIGFVASTADPSLFVLRTGSTVFYLLLYVDDIILTGNSSLAVTSLITQLAHTFELKDLGPLRFFLGLQIDYTCAGLFVHQKKYVSNLLLKFNMTNCKPTSTPFSISQKLQPSTDDVLPDPTQYRSLVGTLHLGIRFQFDSSSLTAFTDSDWAGDPYDRRSTTAITVFLGNNPITWVPKKQHTVSQSSTKAEYRAIATGAAELA
uniref:Reverse transcriptase Ty1/copia-type domain-containing protein n=1 Tax=Fagus sylvatica TaxID=28930 RepID=A0A2N9F271_FAGSY